MSACHQKHLGYWAQKAKLVDWFQEWERTLDWNPPYASWFSNGKLNAAYNCTARHNVASRAAKAALLWEGEPGDRRTISYRELEKEVNKLAGALKNLGIGKGDRVTLYLPMLPELVTAMLACAQIGAVHNVVFGGCGAESLRDRIKDCQSRLLITADGGFRKGKVIPFKENADEALENLPFVEKVIVLRRAGEKSRANFNPARDIWWHDLINKAVPWTSYEPMEANDPLFILHTSGVTRKPIGVVHSTGGYLVGVTSTFQEVFAYQEEDIYWCTADISWITGHSYVVYGPLASGATVLMYEGSLDYPGYERFWNIMENYRVTVFYTAPTVIRTFMKWGSRFPAKHDLASLRLLGTVGEPLNPEVWQWYYQHIGRGRCPIVDTYWQTETGMIMLSPLPHKTALKPGSVGRPLPGVEAQIVNEEGRPSNQGYLLITAPWPAMMQTIQGNPERYEEYWQRFPGCYFTGDGAYQDEDGYIWVTGRVDEVINVSGLRLGTAEVENALLDCQEIAEAAVVSRKHEIKGEAVVVFVALKEGYLPSARLSGKLRELAAKKIGKFARPDEINYTVELPKTKDGKIMRRLLKNIAEEKDLGDTTTLAEPSTVTNLIQKIRLQENQWDEMLKINLTGTYYCTRELFKNMIRQKAGNAD